MPRTEIELPCHVDHVSILDETGEVDKNLEPTLPTEMLLKLHRYMLLGRRFDEHLLSLQRQGRIGTFAPIKGQEASQLGAVAVLRETDWFVPCFRETAAWLWRGAALESTILTFAGFEEAWRIPDEHKNIPVAVPVSTQLLHAVGIAYGIKYRKEDSITMTFFGDGATSEGDFHEALNFAGVFQVPVVFVCQNNQWAISLPRSRQTRSKTLAQKALAYGVPGIQVDGNDVLAVYAASREAEERARSGGGPTMIEAVTYRMTVHTTADDPKRYRSDKEVEEWAARDPLIRFQNYLKSRSLISDSEIAKTEDEIKSEIRNSTKNAEEKMKKLGDPLHMFDHNFEEMTQTLKEQREELVQELAAGAQGESNG
jgi:pyruvate dehydrogenase E1 component alpha subunit